MRFRFPPAFKTPQKVSVETESGNTLVMRGTNASAAGIKGALKFQVRARVLADGGTISTTSDSLAVTNADSVTILIAAATSYKNYQDVSGDPEAIVKGQIAAAAKKKFDKLLAAHTQGASAAVPARFPRSGHQRRHETADRRADQEISATATIRSLPRSISSMAAIC